MKILILIFAFILFAKFSMAGIPPSPPINIDLEIENHSTTTTAHSNLTRKVPLRVTINNPNDADTVTTLPFWCNETGNTATAVEITANSFNGTSVVFTLNECDSDGTSNCAGMMNALTVTTGTKATATLTDTTIADGKCYGFDIGAVTGGVTGLEVNMTIQLYY